jgi:hypothetical protein
MLEGINTTCIFMYADIGRVAIVVNVVLISDFGSSI